MRGVPLTDPLWFAGDGRSGEPANDNIKAGGGRYPLQEEFRSKRLAKTDEEADVLWSTARWFIGHYEIANRPYRACSYGMGRVASGGDLGGYVDREDSASKGSSDPMGYQIEIEPLYKLGKVDASFIESTAPGEIKLHPAESRARSVAICQHLKYRLDCNYRYVVDAVVKRCEMKAIGMAEGAKEGAATAGRMFVRAGLRTASLVRFDITRWEANAGAGVTGPLPDKSDAFTPFLQKAANDDLRQHVRNVA